jgi:hypothetical protein
VQSRQNHTVTAKRGFFSVPLNSELEQKSERREVAPAENEAQHARATSAQRILWLIPSIHFRMIIAAAALKVTCGSDDVVALAPFAAREKTTVGKIWMATLYVITVCFLVTLAAAIGLGTTAYVSGQAATLVSWIRKVAGVTLILYSFWLAYLVGPADPDIEEKAEASHNGSNHIVAMKAEAVPEAEARHKDSNSIVDEKAEAVHNYDNIIAVALWCSLDYFTAYLIVAVSGLYTWYELIIGTFFGCVVLASAALGFLPPCLQGFRALVGQIPVWLVLMCLGVYVFLSAFF